MNIIITTIRDDGSSGQLSMIIDNLVWKINTEVRENLRFTITDLWVFPSNITKWNSEDTEKGHSEQKEKEFLYLELFFFMRMHNHILVIRLK